MNWVSYHWRIKSFQTSFSVGVAAMIRIGLFARCRWRIHKKWRWMEYNGFCFRLCRAEISIDNKSTYKFPPWAPTWDLIPVPLPRHIGDHPHFEQEQLMDDKESHPLKKVQFFWTLFKNPLTPPPPLSFEHYVVNFSEGILTKVRKWLSRQLSTK